MCGSCHAFATIAVIENHLKKNGYVKDVDLSEQEIVDCTERAPYHNDGCERGFLKSTFQYAQDYFISHEPYYKYTANVIMCN